MPFSIDPLAIKAEAQKVRIKDEEDIRDCYVDSACKIFKIDGLVEQEPITVF